MSTFVWICICAGVALVSFLFGKSWGTDSTHVFWTSRFDLKYGNTRGIRRDVAGKIYLIIEEDNFDDIDRAHARISHLRDSMKYRLRLTEGEELD